MLETPVAFFVFRRPAQTARVFAEIARAQPKRLFLIADGPRNTKEAEQCRTVRSIIERIDWPCEVYRDYAEANLGLRKRISSGLDWVFSQTEAAIILEDDCLPDPSFFLYCSELLRHYHDDARIMHISGDNFLPRRLGTHPHDYYFTRYPHIWGWATWQRAWQHYDIEMKIWDNPEVRKEILGQFSDTRERRFWETTWNAVQQGEIVTWDYQWVLTCLYHKALAVNPRANLVSNIGFGAEAVNTRDVQHSLANQPTEPLNMPLSHPPDCIRDSAADTCVAELFFRHPTPGQRLRARVAHTARSVQTILLRRNTRP